jgi:electron transfer flavoprotein beta subunit
LFFLEGGKTPVNMIVCVKQVPDPEAPPGSFKIDPVTNNMMPPTGFPPVISPFDEQAVEAALRIKDINSGKITIISLGFNLLRDVVKKPISMGADELILLEDPAFVDGDSWSTASALAAAIRKIGQYDLIFCGRQAADWDSGQVGSGIAEILGLPQVTLAKKVEVTGNKVKVEKVTADGYEMVAAAMPALITVSNELGEPRYATIKGIMSAKAKEPIVWKPADIGVDVSKIGAAGRRTRMLKLFQPVHGGKCEIITGRNEEDAGANLAKKLVEVKLL